MRIINKGFVLSLGHILKMALVRQSMFKKRSRVLIRRCLTFYLFIVLIGILVGCKSTKYVPEGDYLLKKVAIKRSSKEVSKEDLRPYIRQKANDQIFWFVKFHLGLYNFSGEDQSIWWNRWLRDIGEAPVLFKDDFVAQSSKQLKQSLVNRGFFQADVKDTVIYNHQKRKVKVQYNVHFGPQYKIYDVKYKIDDDTIRKIVFKDTLNSLLKPDAPFSASLHNDERERITNSLRRKGYYDFSKEYIWFLSDSLYGNYQIGDSLMLKRVVVKGSAGQDSSVLHSRYRINSVTYNLSYDPQYSISGDTVVIDTLRYNNSIILYKSKAYIKPSVLLLSSQVAKGDVYDYLHVQRTQTMLTSLRVFNMVNVNFKELGIKDSTGYKLLDCNIALSRAKAQFFSVGLEGTNSSGNFGLGSKFKYQHRNLFNGAELFDFNVRLAGQRQYTRALDPFTTLELGAETGIELPKFLVPIKIETFRRAYNPKTILSLSYDYQKRPDYYRTISNAQISYNWRSSRFVNQNLTPISFNYVRIPSVDPTFWASIENTFLRYSYQDHLVLNSAYAYVFSQQRPGKRENFWYVRGAVEEAGNLLNQLKFLTTNSGDGYRDLFNVRYAQYVKGEVDMHYTFFASKFNSLAYRCFFGLAYPYGNMDVMPFEKQYFSGGANGIRAWAVRGIGPGSHKPGSTSVFNQMGDMKLEMNAEYRYKLFWVLEGAIFADAGNIWTTRYRAEVPDGFFRFNTFVEQIAIGTGAGLRMDFNYFLLRLDFGIQARDPSREAGDRWTLFRYPLTSDKWTLNFAIGYPF